jgi:pimeloyl-ACP methyl ester carboxylesterase
MIAWMQGETRSADGTIVRWLTDGSGPPLVLVPGGLGGEHAFDPLVAELRGRLTCNTMGRRGKGFSGDGPSYSYEREYEDVAAALDVVGPPRFVLGHSSGAICALGAALLSGVDKLVLIEPPLPLTGPMMAAEPLVELQAALARGETEEAVVIGLAHGIKMSPEAIEARRARPEWSGELSRGAGWLREFPEINRLPADTERYGAITAPALLVYGTATQAHHREAIEALGERLAAGEVVAFEGYGHDVPNAAAREVAARVLAFLLD